MLISSLVDNEAINETVVPEFAYGSGRPTTSPLVLSQPNIQGINGPVREKCLNASTIKAKQIALFTSNAC